MRGSALKHKSREVSTLAFSTILLHPYAIMSLLARHSKQAKHHEGEIVENAASALGSYSYCGLPGSIRLAPVESYLGATDYLSRLGNVGDICCGASSPEHLRASNPGVLIYPLHLPHGGAVYLCD